MQQAGMGADREGLLPVNGAEAFKKKKRGREGKMIA